MMVKLESWRVSTKNRPPFVCVLAPPGLRRQRRFFLGSPGMVQEIQLTRGQVALVDDEDFGRVMQYRWYANCSHGKVYYAVRCVYTPHRATIRLHRFILDAPPDKEVDHVSGDPLDNRRCNLRLCSHAENTRNSRKLRQDTSSQFKGVSWYKPLCKWLAQICVDHRKLNLGYFDSEEDAYAAYCTASAKYHREFGRTA